MSDDTTGQTGVLKTWYTPRLNEADRLIRTIRAKFIEARGESSSPTGRIYESNPVPDITHTKSCKTGGDHIWGEERTPTQVVIKPRIVGVRGLTPTYSYREKALLVSSAIGKG